MSAVKLIRFRPRFLLIGSLMAVFSLSLSDVSLSMELSPLELRQLQTRVFEAPPDKVQLALHEWCNNKGSRNTPQASKHLPVTISCFQVHVGTEDLNVSAEVHQVENGTQIRLRLKTWYKEGQGRYMRETTQKKYFDIVYKGIADILVLSEIGVDVKVYR